MSTPTIKPIHELSRKIDVVAAQCADIADNRLNPDLLSCTEMLDLLIFIADDESLYEDEIDQIHAEIDKLRRDTAWCSRDDEDLVLGPDRATLVDWSRFRVYGEETED